MSGGFINIDGSVLEGGGQILRNALSFSCILQKPVHIRNIRSGRSKPGLAAQHMKGVQLLKDICCAQVHGDFIGSTELQFTPQQIKSGTYYCDIQTAGSIALLVQVSLPVLLFGSGKSVLDLKGGTNAAMAPQVDYITEIFKPNLEELRATFDFELLKRGYFPKGGGHCQITVNPVRHLAPCVKNQFGNVSRLFGWSFVAGVLPLKVAYEMRDGAKEVLSRCTKASMNIETYKESREMAEGNCSGIILGCETTSGCVLGGSGLGGRQEKATVTGNKAAVEIEECLKVQACVDSYTQDQLIIYMALADGVSTIRTVPITLHTKTAIFIAELMANVKFNVSDNNDGTCTIQCTGRGFKNRFL